jgi:hypothetical protein
VHSIEALVLHAVSTVYAALQSLKEKEYTISLVQEKTAEVVFTVVFYVKSLDPGYLSHLPCYSQSSG